MKWILSLTCVFAFCLPSCTKDGSLFANLKLQGKWILKGQYDSMYANSHAYHFQFLPSNPNPPYFDFKIYNKVYSNEFATPTWANSPIGGSGEPTSYRVDKGTLVIADSVIRNGSVIYLTILNKFKIISISKNRLVMQHLNPDIYTVDTLTK